MNTFSISIFILIAGILQAFGPPMNAKLNSSLQNPWLASLVSFALIIPIFIFLFAAQPKPLPTITGVNAMPWWAPFGGIVGAIAVFAGLVFVPRLGTGAVAGLLICANLITSLAIDHFGWFGVHEHSLSIGRIVGGILMVAGVAAISYF